jgi:hypothetical protein
VRAHAVAGSRPRPNRPGEGVGKLGRLWTCGFENQTTTAGGEWDNTNGSPAISTSVVRSGAASMRCNPSAAVSNLGHQILAADDPAARMLLRAYIRVDTAPSAVVGVMSWADNGTLTSGFIGLRLNTNRTLIGGGSAVTTGTASSALEIGRWHRVEMDYDDTADTLGCYLDGVLWTTVTAVDLSGGSFARFGLLQAVTADIYFDDCAVNNTSGSVQNGLPGPGKVIYLRPDSAGDANAWATAVGGTAGQANNFGRVNETTPDSTTTYNATTATGTTDTDDFNCGSPGQAGIGPQDKITCVQVGSQIGSSATTTASIVTRVKSQAGGTTTESASTPVNINGMSTYQVAAPKLPGITSYTDPQAGGAWTAGLLDTMQIGYRSNVSQSSTRRVSALWAIVDYIPFVPPMIGNPNLVRTFNW